MVLIIAVCAIIGIGLTLVLSIRALWLARWIEDLANQSKDLPKRMTEWPLVSVLVPACNEGETIGPALRRLATVNYPNLQIVVINDRSTDRTGSIAEEVAREYGHVHVVHVTELPQGWLGKTHALDQGLKVAKGELILFTDADVHFGPQSLRKAVSYFLHKKLDHLTIFPQLEAGDWKFDALVGFAQAAALVIANPKNIGTAKTKSIVGIGAFNMFRRSTWDRTPGLQEIRMDVFDDLGSALLLYEAGASSRALAGCNELSLNYYGSYAAMARGSEKNAFALCHYNYLRSVAFNLFAVSVPISTFILPSLVWGSRGVFVSACVYVFSIFAAMFPARHFGVSFRSLLLIHLGPILGAWIGLRATMLCAIRGGVGWRTTFYRLVDLRPMRRVEFPLSRASKAKFLAAQSTRRASA